MARILIVDDDPDICLLLQKFLERRNHTVDTAFSKAKGIALIAKTTYDLVLSDFRLPDGEGMDILKEVKTKDISTHLIIITGYSDVKVAIQCIKQGAFDYVTKPIHPEEILLTINKALNSKSEPQPSDTVESSEFRPADSKAFALKPNSDFVYGKSPQSVQVKKLTKLVGPTNMSVIISGETGTGKEYVAKAIHEQSERADKPFVALDCGALPKEIAASELFGHKKGSFTGALSDKVGNFELANQGTLFLDEIANLTYDNQVKLLRVLQEHKIRRIGDTKDRPVDVRIIAATNENLRDKVRDGEFREDLYHRLNEFAIQLSPLRERKMEIIQFADHFIALSNRDLNKRVEGFTERAREKITDYYWHGNLRELRNVVKRAVLLTETHLIDTSELPLEIVNPQPEQWIGTSMADGEKQVYVQGVTLKEVAENAEKHAIIKVLERTAYNKTKTAEILDVDRKTLYNKIKAYGIDLSR